MASGFQNNNAQLQSKYYRITIDTSSWSTSNSASTGGGIEPWDYNYFSTLNTSLANSQRRARGNLRFANILGFLESYANCQILDMTVMKSGPVVEAAADDTAVSVAFTVGYEFEGTVLGGHINYMKANSLTTLSDGSTTLLTATTYDQMTYTQQVTNLQNVIQDLVTLGICQGGTDGWSKQYRTYNPNGAGQLQELITVKQPDTPANVWAKITVTEQSALNQQYEGF